MRLMASHPDFKKFDLMQRKLLIVMNPQMFFWYESDGEDGREPERLGIGIAEPERLAMIEEMKDAIGEELDGYVPLPANLADYVNVLEEELQGDD